MKLTIRGPNVWGGWSVFAGRKKLVGGLPSERDALEWAESHNPDGTRKTPLEPIVLR